jgi:hypothetical protein
MNYRRRTALAATGLVSTLALAAALTTTGPAAASSDTVHDHNAVAIDAVVHLAGSLAASTTQGSFAVAGIATDAGTESGSGYFEGTPTAAGPNALHADQTFTGAHGAISIHLDGEFGGLPAQTAAGTGSWQVTSSTGDYAGMTGRGAWNAVADFTAAVAHSGPPTVTFVFTGNLRSNPVGG